MPARSLMNRRRASTFFMAAVFILLYSLPHQPVLGQTSPSNDVVRGEAGDLWADKIIGQDDFGEFMPSQVTGNRVFNPGGVLVDRTVRPNRLYVYDSNSRVLGFNHLGTVTSGNSADIGKPCTSNSDFSGSICTIEEGRPADLVLGQLALNRGACNGDGNFQTYPVPAAASASTLCAMPQYQVSPTEGGSFANMAVDGQGNLYVPDWMNNRVVRYNSPFTTDTIADAVWGQADFAGTGCNRGRGFQHPDDRSICFPSPYNVGFVGGAGVDAAGNLWLTDNANNRVLRFPFNAALNRPASVADLVLGQPNFTSWEPGTGMHQMHAPAAVRITNTGRVYVADSQQDGSGNGRVLYFDPPYSNGMSASGMLNYDFRVPAGLEFDVSGGLWVSDRDNHQLLLFSNPNTITKVLFKDIPNSEGLCGGPYVGDGPPVFYEGNPGQPYDISNLCGTGGSIGVDRDGNILVSGGDFVQDVWRFPAPIPAPRPGIAHSADARIFKPYQFGEHNSTTLNSLWAPRGIAVTDDQLMIADGGAILFWNNPLAIVNGQDADGYVGTPDPRRFVYGTPFGRIRQDQSGHLWSLRGGEIQVYQLPLITGAVPFTSIASPVPVLGGGELTWEGDLLVGGLAPAPDGSWLWVADPSHSRAFRIRNPLTLPYVDIVLGQNNLTETGCNQGRGESQPDATSLCYPGAVVLDPQGNLYVSDHSLEARGNHRLLEYDASVFPDNPTSAVFGLPASRVIGADNDFTGPCRMLCGPFEPAFSSTGALVVGLNSYIAGRFPAVYPNPLISDSHTTLQDYGSMPYAAVFDGDDNLYIIDKNRGRALFYRTPVAAPPPILTVTNTIPAENAADVPENSDLTIQFNNLIYADPAAFNLICGTPFAMGLSGSGTNTLTLNPAQDLPANTACTLTVYATGITERTGNRLSNDLNLHFTTGQDTIPPTVRLITPEFTTGVPVDSSIILLFSEIVKVQAAPVTVTCPNIVVTVPSPALPTNGLLALTLDPIDDLPAGATCTVTLDTGQVTDVADNALSAPGPITFQTVINPVLLNEAPALNVFATGTPTLSWSRLSWAMAYEIDIFSNAALTIRPTGYSASLTAAGNSLTLPAALPPGEYYFRVRGKTAAGGTGAYSVPEPFTIVP